MLAVKGATGLFTEAHSSHTGRVRTLALAVLPLVACTLKPPVVHGNYDVRGGGVYTPVVVRLHTEPTYAIAIVDDIQQYGASSTLRLDATVPHRIEIQKHGYYGQVVHLETNEAYLNWNPLMKDDPGPRPQAFLARIEDLATGETRETEYSDIRVFLEPLRRPAKSAVLAKNPDTIVAVMPTISSQTFDADLFDAIANQIRVGLGARRVPVIDRGRLAAKLAETIRREKTESYRACVDEACQIPLGKALAATHLLRSTLARRGAECSLALELIELSSELTIDAAAVATSCEGTATLDAADQLTEQMFPAESP